MARGNLKEKVKKICLNCRRDFKVLPSRTKRKFCSRECFYCFQLGRERRGNYKVNSGCFLRGQRPWNKNKKTPDNVKKKQRQAKLKNPTRYWLGKKRLGMRKNDEDKFQWKEHRKKNIKKFKKYQRKYCKNRKKNDLHFKLRCGVSVLIVNRLRKRLSSKNGKSTWDFLPYTVEELIQHLEKLFVEGMTWNNYGEWHIDHIKPDSLFDYKSIEDKEFQECWALSNLQPLWAEDNLKKSNKY